MTMLAVQDVLSTVQQCDQLVENFAETKRWLALNGPERDTVATQMRGHAMHVLEAVSQMDGKVPCVEFSVPHSPSGVSLPSAHVLWVDQAPHNNAGNYRDDRYYSVLDVGELCGVKTEF